MIYPFWDPDKWARLWLIFAFVVWLLVWTGFLIHAVFNDRHL